MLVRVGDAQQQDSLVSQVGDDPCVVPGDIEEPRAPGHARDVEAEFVVPVPDDFVAEILAHPFCVRPAADELDISAAPRQHRGDRSVQAQRTRVPEVQGIGQRPVCIQLGECLGERGRGEQAPDEALLLEPVAAEEPLSGVIGVLHGESRGEGATIGQHRPELVDHSQHGR